MTPQEKANELYSKYDDLLNKDFGNPIVFDNQIKQCALIAVDELINMCKLYNNHNVVIDTKIYTELTIEYWQEVKQEIENL